jgi:HSP20 family protein
MSNLIRWDPFERGVSLRDAMNQLFDENLMENFTRVRPFAGNGARTLALDVRETDDELIVEGSLPGFEPEDVDISVAGNILTIKGEHEQEKEEERGRYHYRERRYGACHRTIALPTEVDTARSEASFKNGVLTLTLPKVEETKAKHIEVKA